MRVRLSLPSRGLPGGKSLFFCFAKSKVTKRKGDPCSSSLRFATGTLRCSAQPGSETTRYAQTSFSPDPSGPALLGSSPRVWGSEDKDRTLASSASRLRLPESESIPHPVEAGPRSGDGDGINGKNLFEPKASCFSRRRNRAPQVKLLGSDTNFTAVQSTAPEGRAKGSVNLGSDPKNFPDGGSPFFPLGFFGETKKGNSAAGASPGLVVRGTALKPTTTSSHPASAQTPSRTQPPAWSQN